MIFSRSQARVVSPAQCEPESAGARESAFQDRLESETKCNSESNQQVVHAPVDEEKKEPDNDPISASVSGYKCESVAVRKQSQSDIAAAKRERRFLRQLKRETGKDYIAWIALLQSQKITDRDEIIGWFCEQGFPFAKASWMERIFASGGKPIYAPKPKPKEFRPSAEQHAKWLYEKLAEIYTAKPRLLREDFRKEDVEGVYATWCKENSEKPYKWNTLAKHLNKLTTKKYVNDTDAKGRSVRIRVYPVVSERKLRPRATSNYQITVAA